MQTLSDRAFRDTMGYYASGLTVVSGLSATGPVGFTCQSFQSVSLDPPLVSFTVGAGSTTYPLMRPAGRFVVSVLGAEHREVAIRFSLSGTDKWAGLEQTTADNGVPIVDGAHMWLAGTVDAEHVAGDHVIVIGSVEQVGTVAIDAGPLLFYRGGYRDLAAE